MIKRIDSNSRMSPIVKHNGLIYLSGQVCKDANEDISGQTISMLEKVESLLNQAGSSKQHILSATIYIKTMADFAAMNSVWDNWLDDADSPTRACVEAAMARPELLVEISIVAAEPQ